MTGILVFIANITQACNQVFQENLYFYFFAGAAAAAAAGAPGAAASVPRL
jgi:hypothetical protein